MDAEGDDENVFIVENCPVTMTDNELCSAIEKHWGKTAAFTRMRFLDSKPRLRTGRERQTSTGKALFRLQDPSRLLEVLVPRCRKGHIFSSSPTTDAPCSFAECDNICRAGSDDGMACYERSCNFVACTKCIIPFSRAPLRIFHGDLAVPLKVKRARGAITFPRTQNQLFVHVFPLDHGATSQGFVRKLVNRLGYCEDIKNNNNLSMDIESLEQLVDKRGLHVSNLIAFAVAQLLSLPEVRSSVEHDDAGEFMLQIVQSIKHYVIDLSESNIHPKPFCFFLEMVDVPSAVKVKTTLHDVKFTLGGMKMVLDVQYRGDDKVRKGSILNQNKTVPESKYEEAEANAVSQVLMYMMKLSSGGQQFPAHTKPVGSDDKQQQSAKTSGLNTGAAPFEPSRMVQASPHDSSLSMFEYVSMQIATLREENLFLAQDPLVACKMEGKSDLYDKLFNEKCLALSKRIANQNRKQRLQIEALQGKVNGLMVSRDMDLILRGYQLHNIHDMLHSVIQTVASKDHLRSKKAAPATSAATSWDAHTWDAPQASASPSADPWGAPIR